MKYEKLAKAIDKLLRLIQGGDERLTELFGDRDTIDVLEAIHETLEYRNDE